MGLIFYYHNMQIMWALLYIMWSFWKERSPCDAHFAQCMHSHPPSFFGRVGNKPSHWNTHWPFLFPCWPAFWPHLTQLTVITLFLLSEKCQPIFLLSFWCCKTSSLVCQHSHQWENWTDCQKHVCKFRPLLCPLFVYAIAQTYIRSNFLPLFILQRILRYYGLTWCHKNVWYADLFNQSHGLKLDRLFLVSCQDNPCRAELETKDHSSCRQDCPDGPISLQHLWIYMYLFLGYALFSSLQRKISSLVMENRIQEKEHFTF